EVHAVSEGLRLGPLGQLRATIEAIGVRERRRAYERKTEDLHEELGVGLLGAGRLPHLRGELARIAAAGAVAVGPAIARLARRAEVDVHEVATRVAADAHTAGVQRVGEGVDALVAHRRDGDVHRRAVEVAAALVALVAEAAVDLDLLAEMIV